MAVVKHSFFELIADDCSFVVYAPDFLWSLIDSALLGWQSIEKPSEQKADIAICYDQSNFITDSLIYDHPIKRTDTIHTLNDFFLTLAYLYARSKSEYRLIHCSAYSDGRQNILLLGNKKSGKSFQATFHGLVGGILFADDLLLWNASSGRFLTLGLPPRLRRPVHPDILEKAGTDCFLTGRDLVYMKKGGYAGTAVGTAIEFDRVCIFNTPQDHEDIPLLSYAKEIRKREIQDKFWKNKKQSLDLSY